MKKCHLFNTVVTDGMGDFSHFVDIYNALIKYSDLKDTQFIPFICVLGDDEKKREHIRNKLISMNIHEFYCDLIENFRNEKLTENKELIDSLKDTDQILFISVDSVYDRFKNYINPKALLKKINEHEMKGLLNVPGSKERPLGLGKGCYGIKISETTAQSINEVENTIKEFDPVFYKDLLKHTDSKNFQEFDENNQIILTYFNCFQEGFNEFLSFLSAQSMQNKKLKECALYFSGKNLFKYEEVINDVTTIAIDNKVRIEIIKNNEESVVIYPDGDCTIRIFTGYFITDLSYQALFSSAKIAGISGDNTLEHSVSHQVLPFYYSTNFAFKKKTLIALKEISQLKEIEMGDEARKSFLIFFNPVNYRKKNIHNMNSTNLPAMIEAWPKIASYLKTNKNFYDQLHTIFLEDTIDLSKEKLEKLEYKGFFSSDIQSELKNDGEKKVDEFANNNIKNN